MRLLLRLAPLLLLAACTAVRDGAPTHDATDGFRPAFTVIQLNDVYRIDAVGNGSEGGLSRLVTLARQEARRTGRPVYFVHAGDFLFPSLESQYWQGRQMVEALNYLHGVAPLFMVPGNHEFDDRRPEVVADALEEARFPWLAGNLTLRTGTPADGRLVADTLLTLGGMRVGLFGLTMHGAHGGRDRDYTAIDSAYVAAARRHASALQAAGAEAILALTHLDMADDRRVAALRAEVPALVWVAGGHEHFLQEVPASATSALITKGDSNARRVWVATVGRRDGRVAVEARRVAVDASIPLDPGYEEAITRRYGAELARILPYFGTRIGESAVPLDGLEESVRNRETNLGNYLTDLMRGAFPDVRADVAVLNGGALRLDDVVQGELRFEHLLRTFGFPTRVGLVWLRGRDLRQGVLEHAVSGGRGEGRFLQVSGLRFAFDRRRAAGDRVTRVEVRQGDAWTPLQDDAVYVVAVPDYLFGGGDGYGVFPERAVRAIPPGPDLKLLAFDAIADAYARGEALAPQVEGRIVEAEAP